MSTSSALDEAPLTSFHKRLAVFASGGPFLDGYVLSIIGVAMIQITPQLGLSASQQGMVGAASLVGIFFGAFLGGYLTDRLGRKKLYTVDLLAILACSVGQFFVDDVLWLIILRVILGMAVGADYPIATSMVTEFAPKRHRGPLIGLFSTMWFVGAAVSYIIGELLLHTVGEDAWRWMLLSAAVPTLLIVVMRSGTPESPRWLVDQGRTDEANAALAKVFGGPGIVTVDDLPREVEEKVGVKALFTGGYGKRMMFICVFWTCSIVPLYAVYTFGPAILEALNLDGGLANIGEAFITFMFLLGALAASLIVNRLGRRAMVIHSFVWSGVALALLGLFSTASSGLILALFAGFAIFLGGTQILVWVYPNELFPTAIRGSAVGLASSISRIGAALGTYLVPMSLATLGVATTMYVAAGILLLGALVSVVWAPETRNLSLAESAKLGTPSTPVTKASEPVL